MFNDVMWCLVPRLRGDVVWIPARGTAGFRGVPERHVAGADTRGRQEGWPYPWSQQVIHEISGLDSKLAATENIIDQPEAQNSRDQIADDAKGRETEKQGFHPGGDDHRGGHYQRSNDDAKSKPVGNVL